MKRPQSVPCWIVLCACVSLAVESGTTADSLTLDVRRTLLENAQRWQLPQPAPHSRLLKIWVFQSDGRDLYALGFVEPGRLDRALVGFEYWDLAQRPETEEVVDANGFSVADISPTTPFGNPHGVNFGLLTSIQLLRRGDEKLGLALLDKSLSEHSGHHRSAFQSPAGEEPVLMLARSCLAAALNEITSSKPDFAAIKQRVEQLLQDQPNLKCEATDWMLEGLAASVAHTPAPPGSLEEVIDAYLLSGQARGAEGCKAWEFTAAERTLILKGFEAVPALLDQRHAKRFTNHLMSGFNNFVSYPMNAGQVIDTYLQRLANDEFGSNWLNRQRGQVASDEAVAAWWSEASVLGEQEYVKQRTIRRDGNGQATLSNELLLLASERYPALLPGIYQAVLETTVPSWPVADAVMKSKTISRDQRLALLQSAIATQSRGSSK